MEIMEKSMGRTDFLAVEEFVICLLLWMICALDGLLARIRLFYYVLYRQKFT